MGPCPGVLLFLHTQSATAFSCPPVCRRGDWTLFRINAGLHQLAVRVHGVVEDRPVEQLSKLRDRDGEHLMFARCLLEQLGGLKRTSVL